MHWADRIGRRLKLRHLHILLAVVQCGSMAKAARHLSVSNPVVSKAVADLEHALDARLLDRGAQGVEPTIYGRALLDHALCAFDELRQAVKHVEFLANPTAGEVRIGSSIALASGFIAAVVDRLSRQHPRIIFHLLAAESSMTYRALEERKVDLAIARMFKPVADKQIDAEVLYGEQEVVVAGADNSWTRRRKIDLAELMHEPWTLPPPDTLSGSVIAEAFREKGLDLPPSTIITATVPVRSALLATGRFLTIIPSSVLKFSVNNPVLKRLPVELPTTERPVRIITLKNRTISPVAQLFIGCAREVAKTPAASVKKFRAR